MTQENTTSKLPLIRDIDRRQMSWRALDEEKLIGEDYAASEYSVLSRSWQMESTFTYSCSRILGLLRCSMDIDQEKVEQTVLAPLHLTSFKDRLEQRAWKGTIGK
jgi:hypothetical protein